MSCTKPQPKKSVIITYCGTTNRKKNYRYVMCHNIPSTDKIAELLTTFFYSQQAVDGLISRGEITSLSGVIAGDIPYDTFNRNIYFTSSLPAVLLQYKPPVSIYLFERGQWTCFDSNGRNKIFFRPPSDLKQETTKNKL